MAKAYFVNATPTEVKILLNGGDQQNLAPFSINTTGGTSINAPAWAAEIKANRGANVFGGNGDPNQLAYRSEQSGNFRFYEIRSEVPTTLDLFFFMFEDTVVGEDQTGSSNRIIVIPAGSEETQEAFLALREQLATAG